MIESNYKVPIVNRTLATMLTMTTYGIWLRGDARGWVDDGVVKPACSPLEASDRKKLKHPPLFFAEQEFLDIGRFIGESLTSRMNQRILGLTVQSWHVHLIVGTTREPLPNIVKCTKDAVRWGLRLNRPIWTEGYDKRFCFDEQSVRYRIEYVERHNLESGLSARPWSFIEVPEFV